MATCFESGEFLAIARSRGFIHQCTDDVALAQRMRAGPVSVYVGYDATADSLHVGHLLSIMLLRWLQRTGHRPIVLMGGGTTKIGDPSGRDETRQLLSATEIDRNIQQIATVFSRFLDFDATSDPAMRPAIMVNNAEWLDQLELIPFLRDYGRFFSINRMLTMDSVRLRLDREQNFSFLEFNYMILQAFDFLELSRKYGCQVQVGGSDQWGNIVSGIELARRVRIAKAGEEPGEGDAERDGELYGLTVPLLTTASGAKMGKTASGAVWLSPDRLSPAAYWQFWRNTDDADVERFLKLFTELDIAEINRLATLQGAERNVAKKTLANEATGLLHGKEATEAAARDASLLYEAGQQADAGLASVDLPRIQVSGARLASEGLRLVEIMTELGLASSRSEARRHIAGGAVRLEERRIGDAEYRIGESDLSVDRDVLRISVGRKRHALVERTG